MDVSLHTTVLAASTRKIELHRTFKHPQTTLYVRITVQHALQYLASQECLAQILKRDRAVLGDLGGPVGAATTTKRQKNGSRLAKRRVSFAPDDQLKTMHLYTKVRYCMTIHMSCKFFNLAMQINLAGANTNIKTLSNCMTG